MMKAVAALCLLFAGASAECVDSDVWYKTGDPAKDCAWVAKYSPKRCTVKGWDKSTAAASCPVACDMCNPCEDAPLRADLPNLDCVDAAVQSAMDVTEGSVGLLDATLDPIQDYNAAGMCTVNVHWHLGAEHRSEGEFDETFAFDHPGLRRRLAEDIRTGHMCANAKEMFDSNDPHVANEYEWKYCHGMHVGLSYEIHWPHSSIGACQTEWQLQYPFMDGVLCGATMAGLDIGTAADAIFSRAVGIGVEGQVFTIVNSPDPTSSPYLYPTWDSLAGWNKDLVTDWAYYQGSTTGDAASNEVCRGTGGLVTWHMDRNCHLVEAATIDNLCRLMVASASDDMSPDTEPHGARETVAAEIATTHVEYYSDGSD